MAKKLTADELALIKNNEDVLTDLMNRYEGAKHFNVGDFVVRRNFHTGEIETNSYGVPRKFKVVHLDKWNSPYLKEMNTWGKEHGKLFCAVNMEDRRPTREYREVYNYELDPDYADAVILDSKEEYDPVQKNKQISQTFKDITTYNKSIKQDMSELRRVAAFFMKVKIGDTLWFSSNTSLLVQDIGIPTQNNVGKWNYYDTTFLTGTTNKGKLKKYSLRDFHNKAVYTSRPRSYDELKNPIV